MNIQFKKTIEKLYQKTSLSLVVSLVLAFLLLMAFYSLSEGIIYNELNNFDQATGDFIRSFATQNLTDTAIWITRLGSGKIETILCLLFAGIFYFIFKNKWYTSFLILSLVGGWLLNVGLKFSFQRQRPTIKHLVEVGGYSFPSGHAMVSTIFYGMLGYIVWRIIRSKGKSGWFVITFTILLILSIGTSRVYLGVHFPSDVLAGFTAGGIWLLACIGGLRKMLHRTS